MWKFDEHNLSICMYGNWTEWSEKMTEAVYTMATPHPTPSAHSQVTRGKFYRFLVIQNAPGKACSWNCILPTVLCKELLRGVSRAKYCAQHGQGTAASRSQAALQHAESSHCSTDQRFGLTLAREWLLTWVPAVFEIQRPSEQQPCTGLACCCKLTSWLLIRSWRTIIHFVFAMASSTWKLRYFSSDL